MAKWNQNLTLKTIFIFSIYFILSLAPIPSMATTQAEAEKEAQDVQHKGSDDSTDQSVTNGVTAISNLTNDNIPGALYYGYKAYGNYKNSQKMDKKEEEARNLKASLLGFNAPKAVDAKGNKSTSGLPEKWINPYSKFDKKKLYKGELGQMMGKLENESGLSREEVFSQLAKIADQPVPDPKNPNLKQNSLEFLRVLAEQSPNADFREKINSTLDSMSENSAWGKVVGYFFPNQTETTKNAAPPLESGGDPSGKISATPIIPSDSKKTSGSPAEVAPKGDEKKETPAQIPQIANSESEPNQGSLAINNGQTILAPLSKEEMGKDGLGSLIASVIEQNAGQTVPEKTLFQQVSGIYQKKRELFRVK